MQPTDEFNICMKCKHFDPINGCPAFPDGIPIERIVEEGHYTIYDDQEGDYVFEKDETPVIS